MNEIIAAKLEAIAAMAKSLAYDTTHGKLWEGDLNERISQIYRELEAARALAKQKQ